MDGAVDILILSNGPGELATWVKPVVQMLRQKLGEDRNQVRISVVLSPCANASGGEAAIANTYPEVDRVQGVEHFFPFLLWGKTAESWDWRKQGVVLFLGGDQFFSVIIGKRLRYRTVVYAEWEARWHGWIDRFGVMRPETASHAAKHHAHKFTVVGDLMAEAGKWGEEKRGGGEGKGATSDSLSSPHPSHLQARFTNTPPVPHSQPCTEASYTSAPLIGLLPGSKSMKLSLGLPLELAIAEHIYTAYPNARFVIAVAPSLQLSALANFANPAHNPVIQKFGWAAAELIIPHASSQATPYLKTTSGLQAELWTEFPAYDLLAQCELCLTTVGANTAELGALAVPMVVLLPTQQLDVMRAWDGLPGLLANLPGVGSSFAKVINWLALRRLGLLAWPNIWAKAEIVPELIGNLQPEEVASKVLDFLNHPEKLQHMRTQLRQARGKPGAAEKLVEIVREELAVGGEE